MSVPYFPMYPADFEADTSHLTLEEDGAYNRLLRLCWMTPGCSLPDDDAWIARRMRLSASEFQRIVAPIIVEFFRREDGRVFSPRLMRERGKLDDTYRKRSEAGKRGGRQRAVENIGKDDKAGFDFVKAGPKQPEPEPEPEDIGKPISRGRDRFEDFWAVVPRRIAKEAARRAFAKAVKLVDPDAIIAAMRRYAESRRGQDAQFTAHPSTWLNAGRWADEDQTHSKPADVDKMAAWEAAIKSGKDYLCRNIPASAARALVDAGKVTAEQCKAAGVAL